MVLHFQVESQSHIRPYLPKLSLGQRGKSVWLRSSMCPVTYARLNWIKWCKTPCPSKGYKSLIFPLLELLVWKLHRGFLKEEKGRLLTEEVPLSSSTISLSLFSLFSLLSSFPASPFSLIFPPSLSSFSVSFGTVNLCVLVSVDCCALEEFLGRNYRESPGVLEHSSHHISS